MPEIAEIARVVHFLTLHLVGKTIKKATAIEDPNVFGKAGTTGSLFEDALVGKNVVSCGRQGKYFWLELDKPPHPVLHFGMTGWIHIRNNQTAYTNYYKKMKEEDMELWPPRYWKFQFVTEGNPSVEVAFTDPRRFGRVRLVDCPGEQIRKHSPLVENGPDPVLDVGVFTEDYLKEKMRSRHVPVKALILDQTVISGIGNWVGDEVLYHARLHPEQYCDDFDDQQIHALYEAIRYVCTLAVEKLGDSDQFPEHWLFNHRWGKGKKEATNLLPNGETLAFLTVGGRTSCYAPSRQRKSGRIATGVKEEPTEQVLVEQQPRRKKPSRSVNSKGGREDTKPLKSDMKTLKRPAEKRRVGEEEEDTPSSKTRNRKVMCDDKTGRASKRGIPDTDDLEVNQRKGSTGRRRSSRLRDKSN